MTTDEKIELSPATLRGSVWPDDQSFMCRSRAPGGNDRFCSEMVVRGHVGQSPYRGRLLVGVLCGYERVESGRP